MCKRIVFGQVSLLILLSIVFFGAVSDRCEATPPDPVAVQNSSACTAGGIPFPCCVLVDGGPDREDELHPHCDKVRFITLTPPGNSTGATALRIKLVSLHHVIPPYVGAPSIPFTLFEGQSVYVGPPAVFLESSVSGTTFLAARTQCSPYYHDWNTVGLMHVYGSAIVPSSQYSVEHLAAACNGVEDSPACLTGGENVSVGQMAVTARWADLWTIQHPHPTTQPNVADVAALVNKFRGAAGAPIKAQALLFSSDAFGNMNLLTDVSFSHISASVDAFRGAAYPAKMGKCANSSAACTNHSECGANGPCELYCPD